MSYDSRAVANKILDIADQKCISLTMMQLIKLVYISHGWWLSLSDGQALTSDEVQAWQYGPVYPAVYRSFRHNGSRVIRDRAVAPVTGLKIESDFSDDMVTLMDQVVDSYGQLHAFQLSDMTHQPGTPWETASATGGNYARIWDSSIKEHFDELRQTSTAA
ncbi:MAG: DUF4065 domain-containing protein [Mariniblastus sp.]|nr:DUF4065 domain-containing protein [Mariniblastus sp.]